MERRIKPKRSGIGWEMFAASCPLLQHTEALGEKPRPCSAGVFTNMQGAVPLTFCKHYVKNSARNKSKRVAVIECIHPSVATPAPAAPGKE